MSLFGIKKDPDGDGHLMPIEDGSSGGGVMVVNVTVEGIDDGMNFVNPTADKTRDEIASFVRNGGFVYACIDISTMSGEPESLAFIPLKECDPNCINFNTVGDGTMTFVHIYADRMNGGFTLAE